MLGASGSGCEEARARAWRDAPRALPGPAHQGRCRGARRGGSRDCVIRVITVTRPLPTFSGPGDPRAGFGPGAGDSLVRSGEKLA